MKQLFFRQAVLVPCLLMILLLALLLPPAVHAQEEWFWALDTNTDEIVAYSLAGETHALMPTENMDSYALFRVDAEQAVAVLTQEGQSQFYWLTSTSAEPIPYEEALPESVFLLAQSEAYLVLGMGEQAMALDVAAHTVQRIPGEISSVAHSWHADDSGIYGVVKIEDQWQLIAYADATVRAIQVFDGTTAPQVAYFPETQQWFYGVRDNTVAQYWLINKDGTSELFTQEMLPSDAIPTMVYIPLQNTVLKMALQCTADCAYEQYSLDNELLHTYPVSAEGYRALYPSYLLDDEHFVLTDGDFYWYFTPDQAPVKLGTLVYQRLMNVDIQSPDQRWLLLMTEDAARFSVYDLQTGELFHTAAMPAVLQVRYVEAGLLLSDTVETWVLLDLTSGGVWDLPTSTDIFFFEGNAAGQLQVLQRDPLAIYRYDLATSESVLLVENAMPMLAR